MQNTQKAFTSRVDIEIAENFNVIAEKLGKRPTQLIRELIIGIVENRVKITHPEKSDTEFHKNIYI